MKFNGNSTKINLSKIQFKYQVLLKCDAKFDTKGGEEFSNLWVEVLAKFLTFAQTLDTIYTLSIARSIS